MKFNYDIQLYKQSLQNKKDLEIEKKDDATPLASRFYEIISTEVENINNDLE